MEQEPIKDNGKATAEPNEEVLMETKQAEDKEPDSSLKRARVEDEGIGEPSEDKESTRVKVARIEAPLGIPSCHPSIGGPHIQAYRTGYLSSLNGRGFCSSSGYLPDTETLLDRMRVFAKSHGLDEVSSECAEVLNWGLNDYLKRIIHSCVKLRGLGSHQVAMHDSGVALSEPFLPDPANIAGPSSVFTAATADTGIGFNTLPVSSVPSSSAGIANTGIDLNAVPVSSEPGSSTASHLINLAGGSASTADTGIDLNVAPVSPIPASTGVPHSRMMNLTGDSAGTGAGRSVIQGPIPAENLASVGSGAAAGTGPIFFIGTPEENNTEFAANQMEEPVNANGLERVGVISAGAVGGNENLNGPGQIQYTLTIQDLLMAMQMNPQLLGENWPVKLEKLLMRSFEK